MDLHLCPLEMKFIYLTLLVLSRITDSRSEQYEVVGPADTVFAVAGEDVILPCSVKPNISVVDMRVEWFRLDLKDSVVHLYEDHEDRNTDQIQSYRERTKLNHEELQRGNASLKLSSVQVSDEGRYKCFIQSKSWYDDATVDLSVEAVGSPPVITVDGFDYTGRLLLQCDSEGWYPEPDLEWLDSEGVRLSSETAETHRETDRFSVKHTVTVQHRYDKIHCRLKLRHHMLETVIMTSSKMFHAWRISVIWISITVVLSVIAVIVIAAYATFIKKNREYSQLYQSERERMEKATLDLQNEQTKMQEATLELQNEKTRTKNVTLCLRNEKRRMQNATTNFNKEEKRMQNECFQLLQIQTKTVQNVLLHLRKNAVDITLDADTAHPRLIVSDDGKQVKLGNTRPTKEGTGNENTQPTEDETRDEEQNTQPKEMETRDEEPNTQTKEEETQDEEPNTQPKEEEARDEEQNTQPKEMETRDEEPNTQPKEMETRDEEPNTQPKEEETRDEEPNTQPKEMETRDEEPNTQPKEEETQDEEPNTQPIEEETQDEEPNTQPKEEETGDAEENAQPTKEEKEIIEQNDKFDKYLGVLGKEGFSSGCFYFEVQVKEQTEWDLGVTTESVNKKELFTLSPENRIWTVSHRNKMYQVSGSSFDSFVLNMKLEKVGVFVDYEEGLVSFYDVESMFHIHSYTGQSFNEKLYPFFGLGLLWNENNAPLIISPVK